MNKSTLITMKALLFVPMLVLVLVSSNVFHSVVGSAVVLFFLPVAVGVLELTMLNRMPIGIWRKVTVIVSSFYLGVGGLVLIIAVGQRWF